MNCYFCILVSKLLSSTERYINENQYVNSLPRCIKAARLPMSPCAFSIRKIIALRLYRVLSCIKNYPRQLWTARDRLFASISLGNACIGKRCIVIGNGPSQGYLKLPHLDSFTQNGGDTICVNYWDSNKELFTHIPTWLVLSAPETFQQADKSASLVSYLSTNPSIKILASADVLRPLQNLCLNNKIYTFIDVELPFLGGINPFLPRKAMTSMTLYKALSWALYLGYSKIGVIGMDNTYPRNMYSDKSNRVLRHEVHAGTEDYVVDLTPLYPSIESVLESILILFRDLRFFPAHRIVNMDPYSLTDRFLKTTPEEFFSVSEY